jgi:NADH:ubiquinone oxidoreductase subunit 3 (subunit A)
MFEYFPISIFLIISLGLSLILVCIPFIIAPQKADPEKISAYECGFDPFDDARGKFDIRFYLVAILFIIFDLEVSFLFPWSVVLNQISFFGFWTMIIFLLILTLGFVYEWKKGALEWE